VLPSAAGWFVALCSWERPMVLCHLEFWHDLEHQRGLRTRAAHAERVARGYLEMPDLPARSPNAIGAAAVQIATAQKQCEGSFKLLTVCDPTTIPT
jgi:hypothetical protein